MSYLMTYDKDTVILKKGVRESTIIRGAQRCVNILLCNATSYVITLG